MVLNSRDLNQNGNCDCNLNFDWGYNILKSYRKEIEDDESILKSFLKENIDIQEVIRDFEEDKAEFLVENYYERGEPSPEFIEKFERFLRVIGDDIKSFYIFSKTVASTYYEGLLPLLVWDPSKSKFEIKNNLSGLMNKNTELEVAEYVSYILNSFFDESIFSEEEVDKSRISCIFNIISDIHFLLFRTRVASFKLDFSFDDLKLIVLDYNNFKSNTIYINDFIDQEEKPVFDVMIAKCLFLEEVDGDGLFHFFSEQIKDLFDKFLVDILKIDGWRFNLSRVVSGNTPLFMFSDSQILNSIKEGENTYSFSTIKSIKKRTSKEQFQRFMNLLSQI